MTDAANRDDGSRAVVGVAIMGAEKRDAWTGAVDEYGVACQTPGAK